MKIAAYCRVSTEKEDQLNSLETQKKFFEEYAVRHDHELIEIYTDEGISGTKIRNRTGFLRMMRDARQGKFEMVLVKDISRFARNTVDLLNSTRELKSMNIDMLFLTSNMTVMDNSEFMLTIFGALAQEESLNTSRRVKFGKQQNAKKGRVPNRVYGYNKKPGDYFHMEINEEEAEVIRRIYHMYLQEDYGLLKIMRVLNAEGLKTKRGCAWSKNAVSRILSNPLYTGKIINGKQEVADFLTGRRRVVSEDKWIVVEKPEFRIIEPEVFEKVQILLKTRYEEYRLNQEEEEGKYLFSSLLKCEECGYAYHRTVANNGQVRWMCSGRARNGGKSCSNRYAVVEKDMVCLLKEYFSQVLQMKEEIQKSTVEHMIENQRTQEEVFQKESELTEKINRLQRGRKKYMDMYEDDLITREEMREKLRNTRLEIEQLDHELKLLKYHPRKSDKLEGVMQRSFALMQEIVDTDRMTHIQLRQIIRKIEVDREGNCRIYLQMFGNIGFQKRLSHYRNAGIA